MKNQLLLLLACLFSLGLSAQQVQLSLESDTSRIRIGEQINLQLKGQVPKGSQYQWPLIADTIAGLTVVETGKIDTLQNKELLSLRQKVVITSFDSGQVVIPALELRTNEATAQSKRFVFEVLVPQVSEEQDFYDIKEPLEVPVSLWYYLRWVLLALAVIGLAVLVWWLIKKRKTHSGETRPEPQIPPYQLAMTQLKELEEEKLWQEGEIKRYYSQLVDILRIYLEREFAIKAMESTAGELSVKIKRFKFSELRELQNMLTTSAMVKYAKENPVATENERALELVRQFVEQTHQKTEDDGRAELSV